MELLRTTRETETANKLMQETLPQPQKELPTKPSQINSGYPWVVGIQEFYICFYSVFKNSPCMIDFHHCDQKQEQRFISTHRFRGFSPTSHGFAASWPGVRQKHRGRRVGWRGAAHLTTAGEQRMRARAREERTKHKTQSTRSYSYDIHPPFSKAPALSSWPPTESHQL